jgi:hypothetical protein
MKISVDEDGAKTLEKVCDAAAKGAGMFLTSGGFKAIGASADVLNAISAIRETIYIQDENTVDTDE